MRILFAPFAELGHLTPHFAIADHAAREGHEIAFVSSRDLRENLARIELRAQTFGHLTDVATVPATLPLDNERWLMRWYASGALRGLNDAAIADATEAIERFAPDVMCADPISYAAIVAATRAKLPWAAASTTLLAAAPREFECVMTRAYDSVRPKLLKMLSDVGIEAVLAHHEIRSPWLNTLFATEAFVPRSLSGNDFSHWVGAIAKRKAILDEGSFPWASIQAGRPLVYATFGGGESLAFPEDLIERIADATRPDAQLVVPLQRLFDGELRHRLPPETIAVRRAPQLALLDRAAVAIVHGGASSVAECLCRGVPMLVMPIGHEQPLQAELVERAGVGMALPLSASRDEIAGAIGELVRDPRYRARAAEVARSYADTDAASDIATRVIRLGTERTPQMPGR